jgi:hypothetical protein
VLSTGPQASAAASQQTQAFGSGASSSELNSTTASTSASSATLPTPSWWNGWCDTNYYTSKSGMAAYQLGTTSFLGLVACGPRPAFDGSPDIGVSFFSGAFGQLEWECVELSMRYMYQRFNINPYPANGSKVVWNYSGSKLAKVSNGAAGAAPQPGDVLSYGATSTVGHTSVVIGSSVDGSGNGSITVMEQNASRTGTASISVSGWVVKPSWTTVSGWLHDPQNASTSVVSVGFLGQAHRDLLGRAPDFAGLSSWGNALAQGASRTSVASQMVTSTDSYTHLINQYYQTFLGRQPDAAGLQHWLWALGDGQTLQQVRDTILGSDEYYQRAGGTSSGFVTRIYQDLLGRAPSSSEVSMWAQQLANGKSRQQVISSFYAGSPSEPYQHLVAGFYQTYLHRAGASSEITGGASQLQKGTREEQIIANLVGSDEYEANCATAYVTQAYSDLSGQQIDSTTLQAQSALLIKGAAPRQVVANLEGTTPAQTASITKLYTTYLGRQPESAGLQHWLWALGNGQTLQQVRLSFLGSDEYYQDAGRTSSGFVNRLYQNLMGRAPSSTETSTWTQQLASGIGRADVAAHVYAVTPPEAYQAQVAGYYQTYLQRPASSSDTGGWASQMQQGTREDQVIASIMGSDEYVNITH